MDQTVNDIYFFYAILLVAVGTYLIRAIPFILYARKGKKSKSHAKINLFFRLMGPSMIAALLVTSIGAPNSEEYLQILNYLIGFSAVGLSYWLWKNPGICVIAGVICFSLSQLFFI
ncbi:MAG: branched-chain amino acid transport [Deltaproteobacteria bacterium]|nr:branched-chain amino acid transport [Deltaproteobacteria bacterium]|tara:strand:+ start:5735 stop:6082 length:348 start_codon:yes stop_codon:yes gene_type:complete